MFSHLQHLVRSNHLLFFLSLEANAWQAHVTTWSLGVKTTLCSFPTLTWPYQNPFLWLTDLQWRWGCHWQRCTSASNYPPNTAEYICALILFGLSGTSAVMTTRPTRELAFYTQARGVDVGVWNIAHLCSCKRVKEEASTISPILSQLVVHGRGTILHVAWFWYHFFGGWKTTQCCF